MTIDDLVTKLSTALAPSAWEAVQQVAVINSFSIYETCATFLLGAGGLAWVGRWLRQKASADADSYDSEPNAVFGCLPLTWNIRDKAEVLVEWDNIADWSNSRLNAGLRAFVNPHVDIDFAVRAIGAGSASGK